jgi:hypothetical protein
MLMVCNQSLPSANLAPFRQYLPPPKPYKIINSKREKGDKSNYLPLFNLGLPLGRMVEPSPSRIAALFCHVIVP